MGMARDGRARRAARSTRTQLVARGGRADGQIDGGGGRQAARPALSSGIERTFWAQMRLSRPATNLFD
jgi:hypothetical protein